MFNSLKYAKILEDAGLPRNQAETHIQILSDLIGEEMATKDDLQNLGSQITSLESKVASLESQMATKNDMHHLEQRLLSKIENLEHRMTLKLGGLMAAFLATGLAAAKLMFI